MSGGVDIDVRTSASASDGWMRRTGGVAEVATITTIPLLKGERRVNKPCSVEHCPWPAVCHAMCSIHYQRWRRRGTTDKSTLTDGRFWGELQSDELTPQIPRLVQLLAIGALINRDALDLAPMLLAPANGPVK